MLEPSHNAELPEIPAKRYFTIGEVSELCEVKPHVLRYWEQEFSQLKPVKRRGNRRYYQRQDVILIRQIRTLLYEQGFTIGGARQRMVGAANLLTEDSVFKQDISARRANAAVVGLPVTGQISSAISGQMTSQLLREMIEEVEEALHHLS
jgi:DNA-binding transcriptional MerR regulator